MVSFVIYYHSTRVSNLLQTIRFLEKREPDLKDSELVLVCQDKQIDISSHFASTINIGLEIGTYKKPVMCNAGVRAAKHDLIVLMDSDRILPYGFFTKHTKNFPQKSMLTSVRLYKLQQDYTDEQIESGEIQKVEDFKSSTNEIRKKNMFSGNTIFWKDDFLECGGMDESFVGYGYADNDITHNMLHSGIEPTYLFDEELHLNHPCSIFVEYEEITQFKIISAINGVRYMKKWKIPLSKSFYELHKEIMEGDFDPNKKAEFRKLAASLLCI